MPTAGASRRPPSAPGKALACHACIVVVDGEVLWSRRPDARLPNASTTKMVTGLLVVEATRLREPVLISERAAATFGGGLSLSPGDVYTVGGLLHALLLSSSNDAAVALAEHVAGTEERFVAQMNRLARSLGARDSHFVTSHGLDHPEHFSSPRDLALIGRRVLDSRVLAEIVATESTVVAGNEGRTTVYNRNELLGTYPGAVGIKTGQTSAAGEVLVAAARRHGRVAIAVAMRSTDAAADARRLLDYGFAAAHRAEAGQGEAPQVLRALVEILVRLFLSRLAAL